MTALPTYGETGSCRERLSQFCQQPNGLDIGFGGSPIVPHAICLDRQEGHPHRADCPNPWPTHIVGEADNLVWFKDNSLAWVYSAHVLEDFADTRKVLAEWCRVIRPKGMLVLFLPDQKAYVAHCEKHKTQPNQAHKHADFGLEYVKRCLPATMMVIYDLWPVPNNPYSFDLVAEKI